MVEGVPRIRQGCLECKFEREARMVPSWQASPILTGWKPRREETDLPTTQLRFVPSIGVYVYLLRIIYIYRYNYSVRDFCVDTINARMVTLGGFSRLFAAGDLM